MKVLISICALLWAAWTIQIQGQTSDRPNLIMLYRNQLTTCFATGNTLEYGLALMTKNTSLYSPSTTFRYTDINGEIIDTTYNCDFENNETCINWNENNFYWRKEASNILPLAPVIDERWDKFQIHRTYGERKSYKIDHKYEKDYDLPQSNNFNISISIRSNNNAQIVLCSGTNPRSDACYWIIIDGFTNFDETVIRKCIKGVPDWYPIGYPDCSERRSEIIEKQLDASKWKHFILTKVENRIRLWAWNANTKEKLLLDYKDDDNPLFPTKMYLRSLNSMAEWKVHEYNYVRLYATKTTRNLNTLSISFPKSVCLSLYVTLCEKCNMRLEIEDEGGFPGASELVFGDPEQYFTWKNVRLQGGRSNPNLKYMLYVTVKVPPGDSGFWAMDGIRTCSNNEVKVATARNNEPLICHSLKYPDWTFDSNKEIQNYEPPICENFNIGLNCNISCNTCQGHKICLPTPTGSSEAGCTCAPGFKWKKNNNCDTQCEYGYYGYRCEKKCGKCQHRYACNTVNGNCDACEKGYLLPLCHEQSVKEGVCPEVHGDRNCTHDCRMDSECPGELKCCPVSCGTACMVPQAPEQATEAAPGYTSRPAYVGGVPPEIVDPDQDTQPAIEEGSYVTLKCTVRGTPHPRIIWRKENKVLNGSLPRHRLLSDGNLQIVGLYRHDAGDYECIADNGVPSPARKNIHLTVTEPTPHSGLVLGDEDAKITVTLGAPSYLRCYAYGWPRPTTTWRRGDVMLPMSNGTYEQIRDYTLFIRSVALANLGIYTCHAYNGLGKAGTWSITVQALGPVHSIDPDDEQYMRYIVYPVERPSTVATPVPWLPYRPRPSPATQTYVNTPPHIPTQPPAVYIVPVRTNITIPQATFQVGSEVSIPCDVDGHPTPRVQWYKDGQPLEQSEHIQISESHRLTISLANSSDSGEYTCQADNGYSTATSPVTIQVEALPYLVDPSNSVTALYSSGAIIRLDNVAMKGDESLAVYIQLECREDGYATRISDGKWFNCSKLEPNIKTGIEIEVTNLNKETKYQIRAVVLTKTGTAFRNDLPIEVIETLCKPLLENNIIIHAQSRYAAVLFETDDAQNCDIKNYYISIDNNVKYKIRETYIVIKELSPYRRHKVEITHQNINIKPITKTFWTAQDPGKVRKLRCSTSSIQIEVYWEEPEGENGKLSPHQRCQLSLLKLFYTAAKTILHRPKLS